jgi:beta-lactamase superfamily II metal-dependent hydrolase
MPGRLNRKETVMPYRKSRNKPAILAGFLLGAVLVSAALLAIFSHSGGRPWTFLPMAIPRVEGLSGGNAGGAETGGGGGGGSAAGFRQGRTSAGQDRLTVHFLDVGQGDSIFIQSGNHFMLIDAGGSGSGEAIVGYLREHKVERLDYLIASHPHEDHIGGLSDVINNFDVDRVIMPPKVHTTAVFEDVIDTLEARQLSITFPEPGTVYPLGQAEFTILGPVQDYGEELNNWSIALLLSDGSHRFFFGGDMEAAAEADMLAYYPQGSLQAEVLKLNHHGSNTSSSAAFLDALRPSFAVISCGADNSYGHPHQEVLESLEQRFIQLYRTDLQGTVVVTSYGSQLIWETEKELER